MYKYIHKCRYGRAINENRGHEFGRQQGGVYERVWREENKREMM